MQPSQDTSARITRELEAQNKSVSWLSREARIGRTTLGRSLKGERSFRHEELERIAIALGIDPKELLGDEEMSNAAALAAQAKSIQRQLEKANEVEEEYRKALELLSAEHAKELETAYTRVERVESALAKHEHEAAIRENKLRQLANTSEASSRHEIATLRAKNRLVQTKLDQATRQIAMLNDRVKLLSDQLSKAKGGALIAGIFGAIGGGLLGASAGSSNRRRADYDDYDDDDYDDD